jgi:hypothetical protein
MATRRKCNALPLVTLCMNAGAVQFTYEIMPKHFMLLEPALLTALLLLPVFCLPAAI